MQGLMAEGLLLSGRMLKDHLLGAVLEGLDGAIEASKQARGDPSEAQDPPGSSPRSPRSPKSSPRSRRDPLGLGQRLEDTGRAMGQGIHGAGDLKALKDLA